VYARANMGHPSREAGLVHSFANLDKSEIGSYLLLTAKKLDTERKPFDHRLIRFQSTVSLPQLTSSSKSKNTSPLHGPEHFPVI
jgi:hypothetical protein